MNTRQQHHGFTLIEVMIVVAIVAILAAVALPSYQDHVRRGTLPDAFTALSDYKVKMEQYFQDHRAYGAAACADTDSPSWNDFKPKGGSGNFTFTCTLASSSQFTLTATGAKGAAVGHVYTIDQDGARATTQFKGSGSTAACWLMRGDEC